MLISIIRFTLGFGTFFRKANEGRETLSGISVLSLMHCEGVPP